MMSMIKKITSILLLFLLFIPIFSIKANVSSDVSFKLINVSDIFGYKKIDIKPTIKSNSDYSLGFVRSAKIVIQTEEKRYEKTLDSKNIYNNKNFSTIIKLDNSKITSIYISDVVKLNKGLPSGYRDSIINVDLSEYKTTSLLIYFEILIGVVLCLLIATIVLYFLKIFLATRILLYIWLSIGIILFFQSFYFVGKSFFEKSFSMSNIFINIGLSMAGVFIIGISSIILRVVKIKKFRQDSIKEQEMKDKENNIKRFDI